MARVTYRELEAGREFWLLLAMLGGFLALGLGSVAPALNFYPSQREPIGTPAVQTRWSEDLYVTLMSVERDGRAGRGGRDPRGPLDACASRVER